MPRWKRGLDLVCCAAAFPFFAILTCAIAIMMRIASPGPVFFRQRRVGLGGRRFTLFKFRTMRTGSDTRSHQEHLEHLIQSNIPMQKLDARGDARLIPGGWILRCTGLDELPQIMNVWRGEMSIVGPRPCIPYEYEQYSPEHRRRLDSVPGLTGLWQVSGKNRTTFEEMIRLDRAYGMRKSLWLDLKIILLTPPALCIQVLDTRRARRAAGNGVAPPHSTPHSRQPDSVASAAGSHTLRQFSQSNL